MNRQTQVTQVRDILLEDYRAGGTGLNSVYIREKYFIVDVATRLFDNKRYFKSIGLVADKKRQKNGTATYFLKPLDESSSADKSVASTGTTQPQIQAQRELQPWEKKYESYVKDGRTYWKEVIA